MEVYYNGPFKRQSTSMAVDDLYHLRLRAIFSGEANLLKEVDRLTREIIKSDQELPIFRTVVSPFKM